MNKKRANIVKGIAIGCFFYMIMGLISGVFGGSTRDGAVYPPVELKALPLEIIKYVMYGGIPCSAIALLIDEEIKWVKKKRTSKPYMRFKYYKFALFIFVFLSLIYAFVIHYIGIWSITACGELEFNLYTSLEEVLLRMLFQYCPFFCILSLSLAYMLQLWNESDESGSSSNVKPQ